MPTIVGTALLLLPMSDNSIGLEAFINMGAFRAAYKEYNASVSKMNDSTGAAASGITGKFQNMGNSILGIAKGLGTAMVAGATAAGGAIAAFVGSGVKLAIALEDQMAGVRAILGATAEQLDLLKQKTVSLGLDPNLKVSSVEAAAAMEMLARNGLSVDEILNGAAEATILLANATGAEFADAANIATDAMAIFNIEADQMIAAVDGISAVTTSSKFDILDYNNALAQGGGVAATFGVEFDDFNTTIAAISPLFKSGADAGTAYKTMLQRIANPTGQAMEAMIGLGLATEDGKNLFYDAEGNLIDMSAAADLLNRTTENLTEQQKAQALSTIFGADAVRAATGLALSGADANITAAEAVDLFGVSMEEANRMISEGVSEYDVLQAKMAQTSALDQAAIRVDTLAGAMDIFAGIIEAVKLQVGDAFIPLIRQVVEGLSAFVESNQEKIVGFFQSIAAFISTFVGVLQTGAGPVSAFLSALSAAGVSDGIVGQIGNFVERARELIDVVREFVTEHSEGLKGALIAIGAVLAAAAIAAAIMGIVGAITAFATGIGPIILLIGLLGGVVAQNWDTIQAALANAWTVIEPILSGFGRDLSALWETLKTKAAEAWAVAQPILEEIGKTLLGVGQRIKPAITMFGVFAKQIGSALAGGGIRGALSQFMSLWPAMQAVINGTIVSILSFLGAKFGVDLVGIFNQVRAVLGTAWTVITGIISSAVEVLRPTVQGLIDGFSSAFSSFMPLGETFKNLWETLQPIIATAAAVIGAVLLALVSVVVGVFNGIIAAINPLITTLGFVLNGVVTFVDGALELFTGFFNLIVGLFTGNTEKMQLAWAEMGAGITKIVLGLVEAVVGFYNGLGTTLFALVSGIVEGVIGFFQNLYNVLVGNSIIPDLVNAIVEWITNLQTKFIALVVGLVTNVIAKFLELKTSAIERVQALKDAAISLFDALKTAVTNKIELLKIAATNKFNLIKTAVIEKLTELKNNAIAKALEIQNGLLDKFDKMKNRLLGKVDEFKSIGSSLIQGIKDGIMDQVSALVQAVEGVIDLLPAAAKSLLGIASPSKLFYSFGVNVIRGLINGVMFMRSAASAAMSRVMGQLPGVEMNVSASSLARGSSNAGVAAARPSVVQLDPSSLRGVGEGGDTHHHYHLNNRSSGSQLGVRQAFRLMELSRA